MDVREVTVFFFGGSTGPLSLEISKDQLIDVDSAVVPVVWTGSGKNKLRPVAG